MLSSSDHPLRGGAPGLYQQVDTTDQNQDPSLYDGPRGSSLGGEEGHDRSIKNSEYSKIQNEEAISCQQQEFSLRDISRDKKILLLMMAVCNFCAAANFSILGPFFPQEAMRKGTSMSVVGLIFGIFELVSFLASPIIGNYGYLELFTGVGMMVGPAIGGGLYSLWGYGLPFYVLGCVLVIAGIISFFTMPKLNNVHRTLSVSVLHLLKSPLVWFVAGCIISGSYSISYLEATLSGHLLKLGISAVSMSLMFLIPPALYAITSPIWGWISDSKNYVVSLVMAGALLTPVFFLTLGPSPLLPLLPFSLWLVSLSLVGVGIFLSCLLIPSFTAILIGAENLGMDDNLDTFGVVSGFYNSCYSLGAFIGPISGSVLVEAAGFSWGSTLCAGVLLMAGLGLLVFVAVHRRQLRQDKVPLLQQRKFSFRRDRPMADIEMTSGFIDKDAEETEQS
ncbi:MFS-type transporter SLC18B1-like isoform X2 [Crassostrea virginica]